MKRSNFRQRGFTLVEMIFVLAIILTLVAIFLPLATSKLSDANTTRAKADEDAISAALTAFFTDLSIWPASLASTTGLNAGQSSNDQNLRYLLVGDGGTTITSTNPTVATTASTWDTNTANCPDGTAAPTTKIGAVATGATPGTGCATRESAFNHLVVNDPNASGVSASTGDYKSTGNKKWKGPYIAKLASDPYGNNYVINLGGVTGKKSTEFGWILSAGTNGSLDTDAVSTVLSTDDIGYIYCTNCQ